MPLEVFNFIKDLVATNPLGTDPKSEGDDHIRGSKLTLINQFEGFTDGIPLEMTESELNGYEARLAALEAPPTPPTPRAWVDETAARSLNTDYTNNDGHEVEIAVTMLGTGSVNYALVVDGVTVFESNADGSTYDNISAGIPPDSVYQVVITGGSGQLHRWAELK